MQSFASVLLYGFRLLLITFKLFFLIFGVIIMLYIFLYVLCNCTALCINSLFFNVLTAILIWHKGEKMMKEYKLSYEIHFILVYWFVKH